MRHATHQTTQQVQTTRGKGGRDARTGPRSELRESLRGMDYESGSASLSPGNQVQMETDVRTVPPEGGDVAAAIFKATWALLQSAAQQGDPAAAIGTLEGVPGLRAHAKGDGGGGARTALRRIDRWQRVVTTVTLPEAEGLTEKHRAVLEASAESGEVDQQIQQSQGVVAGTRGAKDREAKKSRAKHKRRLERLRKQKKRTQRSGGAKANAFYVANQAYEDALARTGVAELEALADDAWEEAGARARTGGDLEKQLRKVRGRIFLPEESRLKAERDNPNMVGDGYLGRDRLSERYEQAHELGGLESPGSRRAVVGTTAQNACEFDGAEVERLKSDGKVWRVTLASGAKVVVKEQDGDDRIYADLARASGLMAPETRELDEDEVLSLRQAGVAKARRGWAVMNHVEGQNLIEKTQGDVDPDDGFGFLTMGRQDEVTLHPRQLEVMGRSIAFQLLMRGWDRWELPVGPEKGNYNLENMMIANADGSGTERVVLIDNTGTAHRGKAGQWQGRIDGYVDEVIAEGDGGTLVRMAARRLKQASYKIGDAEQQHLRQGFINFLLHLREVDLGDVVQQTERDSSIMEFCAEMQAYFLGKVDEMAQRVEGENAQKAKLLGHLHRYTGEKKGLQSKRARAKARIKKMKRGMGEGEADRFDAYAQRELDAVLPSKK